jgi:hypothetical protein
MAKYLFQLLKTKKCGLFICTGRPLQIRIVEIPFRPWLRISRFSPWKPVLWFLVAIGLIESQNGDVYEFFWFNGRLIPAFDTTAASLFLPSDDWLPAINRYPMDMDKPMFCLHLLRLFFVIKMMRSLKIVKRKPSGQTQKCYLRKVLSLDWYYSGR